MTKKIIHNEDAYIAPLAMALIVLFIVIIIATLFPEVKQTIIDIAQAFK
jgi:hypothetical protein